MQAHTKAIILARVSSRTQEEEGYSLDAQLKIMRDYCKSKGLTLVKEFRIAESASKQERRKVFHELLVFVIKQRVYNLVVEKTDRLTRNFKDAVSIDEWLEGDEKRMLHLVKENLQLHKNSRSEAKFMLNIYLAFAKKYIDNLREEAMKGWAEKLAQGWLPATPPPGYMTIVENYKKIHVPNPDTLALAQRLFKVYTMQEHSLRTVTQEMTDMGFLNSKGRPFTRSFIGRTLSNPFYIGINRFDGKDYPGAQEPIITKALFKKVQEKLHRKSFIKSVNKHNPIFKGLIRCSVCGCCVSWSKHKGRYYGSCGRLQDTCKGKKMLREDRVERTVIDLLEKMDDPEGKMLRKAKSALHAVSQQYVGLYRERVIETLSKQLERVRRMDEMLYEDKLAGQLSQEAYNDKHQQFAEQSAEVQERLTRLFEAQNVPKVVLEIEPQSQLVRLYLTSTASQKRLIIITLFQKITTNGDQLMIDAS